MSDNSRYSGAHVLLAFAAGAAAGAVVALLTAPNSGKETRAKLRNWAEDMGEKAAEIPADLKAAYGRATEAAKSTFSRVMHEAEHKS